MPLFQARFTQVEAMRFDGTPASAREIVEWARSLMLDIAVRERIEYHGWDDHQGHVEIEVQDQDLQAGAGDWLVCNESAARRTLEVVEHPVFCQRFVETT